MKYTVQTIIASSFWLAGEGGPYYLVRDGQNFVVCECTLKHNAELICKLLNNHT